MKTGGGKGLRFLKSLIEQSQPDRCIIWPFGCQSAGYGMVAVEGRQYTAHRWVLVLHTGQNPLDKDAAHGPCHNRLCVNPKHLSWKTRSENNADMVRDGTDARGEKCSAAKLTEAKVLAIRADSRLQKEIALDYGVRQSQISRIKTGVRWNHLDSDSVH